MGQITNALLLEKGLKVEFLKAFNNGEQAAEIMPLIMETTSSADSEKYGWLGEVPQVVEWKDERQLKGLKDFNFSIPNTDYEATLQIDRNVMEDDQLGATQIRIRDLAARALTHVRALFFGALNTGDVDLAYDGQAMFSTTHAESGSNQSNLLAGTSSAPYTAAQFSADFESARAALRGFQDDQGEPRNEGELNLYVVCSPAVESVADKILSADLINNTTNTLKGAARKIVSSRLSGEDWYLADANGVIKPFVKQLRKAIEFELLGKGTEQFFMRKKLLAGVNYRIGFGNGAWYKIIKINN